MGKTVDYGLNGERKRRGLGDMGMLIGRKAIATYVRMDWRSIVENLFPRGFPCEQIPPGTGTWYASAEAVDRWAESFGQERGAGSMQNRNESEHI